MARVDRKADDPLGISQHRASQQEIIDIKRDLGPIAHLDAPLKFVKKLVWFFDV